MKRSESGASYKDFIAIHEPENLKIHVYKDGIYRGSYDDQDLFQDFGGYLVDWLKEYADWS